MRNRIYLSLSFAKFLVKIWSQLVPGYLYMFGTNLFHWVMHGNSLSITSKAIFSPVLLCLNQEFKFFVDPIWTESLEDVFCEFQGLFVLVQRLFDYWFFEFDFSGFELWKLFWLLLWLDFSYTNSDLSEPLILCLFSDFPFRVTFRNVTKDWLRGVIL